MRLAFVIEQARIDGTVLFVIRQTHWLVERGHAVTVICADGAWRTNVLEAGARVIVIDALASQLAAPLSPAEIGVLRSACASVDAVIAVAGRAFPAIVSCNLDVPIFLDLLSNDLFVGDTATVVDAVRSAAAAGRVIVHSVEDAIAQAERYGFDVADVRFAPLPIMPKSASAEVRPGAALRAETRLLTITRLDDDHVAYLNPLFDAIVRLNEGGAAIRLDVIGDGTHERDVRKRVPEGVRLHGFQHDLEPFYREADIYVGEGSSRLEAARAGLPVISSAAQTHPHLAGHALFLFGMHSGTLHTYRPTPLIPSVPFDDALNLLREDDNLRTAVTRAGSDRVADEHAPARYIRFLEDVLSGRVTERGLPALRPAGPTVCSSNAIAELARAGERIAKNPAMLLDVAEPVAWSTYAMLPVEHWPLVADASRRYALFQDGEA